MPTSEVFHKAFGFLDTNTFQDELIDKLEPFLDYIYSHVSNNDIAISPDSTKREDESSLNVFSFYNHQGVFAYQIFH